MKKILFGLAGISFTRKFSEPKLKRHVKYKNIIVDSRKKINPQNCVKVTKLESLTKFYMIIGFQLNLKIKELNRLIWFNFKFKTIC